MQSAGTSRVRRIAQTVARALVRAWPAESREWGLAFQSELAAIESSRASLSWLIGGIMLLLREYWKSFWRSFRRPFGVASSGSPEVNTINYARSPRTPRWLTALLLASSAAILLLPEVRTALGTVYKIYARSEYEPSRWHSVKKLRQLSTTNRDPQLLALLSLVSEDDAERLQLSDEAIRKDPSLTWLDFEQSLLPLNNSSKQTYISQSRATRLLEWDSANAVPYLLEAEIAAQPHQQGLFDSAQQAKLGGHTSAILAGNPQWIAFVDAAFSVPQYDDYESRVVSLLQDCHQKFGVNDPDIALFILSRKRWVNLALLRAESDYILEKGTAAERNHDLPAAIASYSSVVQFAQKMEVGHPLDVTRFVSKSIGVAGAEKLQKLYEFSGQSSEASVVATQLSVWKGADNPRLVRSLPAAFQEHRWQSAAWAGLQIHGAAIALVILSPLTLLSLLFLWSRTGRAPHLRAASDFCASIFVGAGPFLLLAASALLFLAYHPISAVCNAFLTPHHWLQNPEPFVVAASTIHIFPGHMDPYRTTFLSWTAATFILAAIAIVLLYRLIFPNRKHSV